MVSLAFPDNDQNIFYHSQVGYDTRSTFEWRQSLFEFTVFSKLKKSE